MINEMTSHFSGDYNMNTQELSVTMVATDTMWVLMEFMIGLILMGLWKILGMGIVTNGYDG